ncbi:MarR family winged helix-turn-helix transcriptional regulator [Microbacterium sp. GXS0129]|jgi:DNA-binding MarR family transcriptional regulator|uniref:MarR family winged helix-turn-helix transcriptional regulator n=1 Tax=Microbacterium sp. GXS0129 TaxID=3377836 RepID=UPI00383A8CB1
MMLNTTNTEDPRLPAAQSAGQVAVMSGMLALLEAERRVRVQMHTALKLSSGELAAMQTVLLAEPRGVVLRQRELAELLGMKHSAMSTMIDRLVSRGDMVRDAHPDDRRSIALRITEQGAERVARTMGEVQNAILSRAAELTEDEQNAVARFLHSVAEDLTDLRT